MLVGFDGVLQVDGFTGYNRLQRAERQGGSPLKLAYCWSHGRRGVIDAMPEAGSPIGEEILQRIAALYAIEKKIRGSSPAQRRAVRQERAKPLIVELEAFIATQRQRLSPKSKMGEALAYLANHWEGLCLYLDDGRIEMGRVDDWRGSWRSRGVAVARRLSPYVGASFRTMTPFPVAAHQTGHADFPHPAFSRPIRPSLSVGRHAAGERGKGRASRRDTRPGSGGTRSHGSPLGASTSGGCVDLYTSERGHRYP